MRTQLVEKCFILFIEHKRVESAAQRTVLKHLAQTLLVEENADISFRVIPQSSHIVDIDRKCIGMLASDLDQATQIRGRKRHLRVFTTLGATRF